MKNLLSFLLALLFSSGLFAQIIDFPDQNFKNKLMTSAVGEGIAYNCSGNSFKIDANNDGEIDAEEALAVCSLYISGSAISDLTGIEYFTNLIDLTVNNNYLTELDLTPLHDLEAFRANNNQLTDLSISGLEKLKYFMVNQNNLTSIDISNLPSLYMIFYDNNQISSFNFNDYPQLKSINIRNNLFTNIDVSGLPNLYSFDISHNLQLETVSLKNGYMNNLTVNFTDCDELKYICAEPYMLNSIWERIIEYGYSDCFANSMCHYIAGEDFYPITGQVKYDEEGDGCQPEDIDFSSLTLEISDGNHDGEVYLNEYGEYISGLQEGTYTMTPLLHNPEYFVVTPDMVTFSLSEEDNTEWQQDFCITANGDHPDLEIFVKGVDEISANEGFIYPGGLAEYKIIYQNKGTMTQSGSVQVEFNSVEASFIQSEIETTSVEAGLITWEFSDLKPFESRNFEFTLQLTSSGQPGGLDEGDYFDITASITSPETDETPEDNIFHLSRLVTTFAFDVPKHSFSDFFKLYPNPSERLLHLEIENNIVVEKLEIYNTQGKRIDLNDYQINSTIDVSSFPSGVYFLKIHTPKGIFSNRFIKK